jgi:hypothetical protein
MFSKFLDILKRETKTFINDCRLSKRYELPLKLNYYDPLTKREGESLAKNISSTGLRFSVATKIPKGTMLDLRIEDPWSNTQISSRAKIIWMEEFITKDDAEGLIYEVGVKLLKKKLWN